MGQWKRLEFRKVYLPLDSFDDIVDCGFGSHDSEVGDTDRCAQVAIALAAFLIQLLLTRCGIDSSVTGLIDSDNYLWVPKN